MPAAYPEQCGGLPLPLCAQAAPGAATPLGLLPWHTHFMLTLLPMSLEIRAFFMAAMRPSIISEGAMMWQPAGEGQK